MKTMFTLLATLLVALLLGAPAYADPYGTLTIGGDQRQIEDILGTSSIHELEVRGAFGYQFENWRGEIEYTYLPSRKGDRDDALIAMALYDFSEIGGFTPFLGIGAGVALEGIDIEGGLGQFSAGLSYPVTDNISAVTAYHYRVNLDGFEEDGQAVVFGARMAF